MYRVTRHGLHYPVGPLHENNNLGIVKEDAASSHRGGSVGGGIPRPDDRAVLWILIRRWKDMRELMNRGLEGM